MKVNRVRLILHEKKNPIHSKVKSRTRTLVTIKCVCVCVRANIHETIQLLVLKYRKSEIYLDRKQIMV